MLGKVFNSIHFQVLSRSMDASMLRNEVIANNIANVNTPGFKRSEVIFEEKLRKVLEKTTNYDTLKSNDYQKSDTMGNSSKILEVEPELVEVGDSSFRNDGNNVDIDVEMAELVKNKVYYDTMEQSLDNEIRLLRMAITGRS
ncbi:MAG: flagellar basal body rod protein FlgB [Bacillota bacterium]|nr:flagellar basal body rod protein FlgB [Bacillota bacterium]